MCKERKKGKSMPLGVITGASVPRSSPRLQCAKQLFLGSVALGLTACPLSTQGADLLPGKATPMVTAGVSLIGRLANITAAQLQLALEASIASRRVLATALVPIAPASSPEVLTHPHIAQRHMQVPADAPAEVSISTACHQAGVCC